MARTLIQLEYPYNNDWAKGYLNTNSEGRKTITLYNSHKNRSSTQYARYLLSVSLKRYLTKEEQVDHIDNDKTNDNINNLQILSLKENVSKSNKKPDVYLICPVCYITFKRTLKQLRGQKHKLKDNKVCCSRTCGGKYSHITKKNNI